MRALLSEALDCIRQAINGGDQRSGIGDPTGRRPPMTAELRPPNIMRKGDMLVSISRKFCNRRRAGKSFLRSRTSRLRIRWIGRSVPDAKTNAALPPKLASTKGTARSALQAGGLRYFFTDRPEDQGEVRWQVAADYLRRRHRIYP